MEMPDSSLLAPLLKILAGFIICTIVSVLTIYGAFIGLLMTSNFLGAGNPKGILFFFTCAILCLLTFPIGGWILYEDLRAVEPNWLFQNALAILFGCSLIFLFFGWLIFVKTLNYWNNWHPQDGEQKIYYKTGKVRAVKNWKNGELHGKVEYYCEDGRVYFKAEYECGKRIGEVFETSCSKDEYMKTKKLSYYEPAGNLIAEKQFTNGILRQDIFESRDSRTVRSFTEDGTIVSEGITEFEVNAFQQKEIKKTISRSFDASTKKLTGESIHEYKNKKIFFRSRRFSNQSGEIISEERRSY